MIIPMFRPQPERPPRLDVVEEALSWVDTPFGWQQSCKGIECDCKGLIVGVSRELGRTEWQSDWAQARDYRVVKSERLLEGVQSLFDPMHGALEGDILLLNVQGRPQHMGIVTEAARGIPIKMVHTYNNGPRCVRNVTLGSMVETVHSIWAWRD